MGQQDATLCLAHLVRGGGHTVPKGSSFGGPAPLCTWPHFQVGSGAIGMPFFLLTRTPHALCASDPPWNGVIGGPPHGVGGYMQRGDSVAHSGCMATRAGHRAGRERPGYWRQWGPWGGHALPLSARLSYCLGPVSNLGPAGPAPSTAWARVSRSAPVAWGPLEPRPAVSVKHRA